MTTLFRKAALDHVSNPDQLDQVLRVVRPLHALGVVTVAVLALAALLWSVYATAPIKLRGQGILLSEAGVAVITTPSAARIDQLLVAVGDSVHAGQDVATLLRPALQDAIVAKREELQMAAEYMDHQRQALSKRNVANEGLSLASLRESEAHVHRLTREVARLEREYERNTQLHAPVSGTVVELTANRGDLVAPGQTIMRLLSSSAQSPQDELRAIVYVANAHGKRVRPGMRAQVMPTTTHLQKDGFIAAEVVSVAQIPSSREGMMRRLNNAILVDTLLSTGAPFEIELRLMRDPSTPSGFQWSSGSGPNITVDVGTMTYADMVVDEQRILGLVLPALDRALQGLGVGT